MSTCPDTFVPDFHEKNFANEWKSSGISYSRLGKTDLIVSNLSLGGAAFGNIYSAMDQNTVDQNTVNDIVLHSIKSGINYIDTAPFYGQGVSETRLGIALQNIPRSAYYIATKVGRYAPEVNKMLDFSVKTITTQFAESLKRLQVDYVDVIQIHDVEFCKNVHQIVKVNSMCLISFSKIWHSVK